MIAGKQSATKHDDYCTEIVMNGTPLQFAQLVNVSIDAPTMDVSIGCQGLNARVYNSSAICKK